MTEPGEILKLNLDREKRIKEFKESDPRKYEKEIAELVNKVRKGYRTLIVSHTAFLYGEAPRSQNGLTIDRDFRDVTGLLWKTCFYKQITEFRGSLRKHANQLDALSQQVREQPSVEEFRMREQQERIYIARLTQAFLSFLSDSIAFYQKMIAELEDQARQKLRSIQDASNMSSTGTVRGSAEVKAEAAQREVQWLVLSVHRCLLYLGDLARYKEMYVDKEPKEFLESLRYYERAALIDPTSGNAQNQLAVLATYSEAECVAVYHYCRSILSLHPFSGGFENLALLFAKNAVQMRTLMTQDKPKYNPLARGLAGLSGNNVGKGKKAVVPPLKHFLTQFVYLHGQLFAFTTDMHQNYAHSVSSQSQSQSQRDNHSSGAGEASWTRALSNNSQASQGSRRDEMLTSAELITHFNAQLHTLLDAFMEQFSANTLTDALLVRLLAICLFSIHYAVSKDANFLAYTDPSSSACTNGDTSGGTSGRYMSKEWMRHYLEVSSAQPRSVSESLALQLLYGIVSRTATRVAEMVTAHERNSRTALNRALPMLSVFADWAQLHTHYAATTTSITTTATSFTTSVKANIATTTAVITTTTVKLLKQAPTRVNQSVDDVAPPSMFADAPELTPRHALNTPSYTTSNTSSNTPYDESAYLADQTLLRTEARARSGMRTAVAALRSVLDTDLRANEHYQEYSTTISTTTNNNSYANTSHKPTTSTGRSIPSVHTKIEGVAPVQQFLREHIELRGFLPLASHIEGSFEHFDPFCRALNVMSESWSRLHRQLSVMNFIDAAFVTTDVSGGAVDAYTNAKPGTASVKSAIKKTKGSKEVTTSKSSGYGVKEPSSKHLSEDHMKPSDADFPALPKSTRPSHHTSNNTSNNNMDSDMYHTDAYPSNSSGVRAGPPALPSYMIDRSFVQTSGTGTQNSDSEVENDVVNDVNEGVSEVEHEGERVSESMTHTEYEDDLLDDHVVFQSAFLRAFPSNEAFVTEKNEWTSPTSGLTSGLTNGPTNGLTSGLLYPSSHPGSSSRLDGLFQEQRATPSYLEHYLHNTTSVSVAGGAGTALSTGGTDTGVHAYGGLGYDLGLDLDLDLSRLVQSSHNPSHQPLQSNTDSNNALAGFPSNTHNVSMSAHKDHNREDKLSTLFGNDSLLGGYWNDTSLPALPQPHASFGHAFTHNTNNTFEPTSTTMGLHSGYSGLNAKSVGGILGAGSGASTNVSVLGGNSWSFDQLNAFSALTTPQQAMPSVGATTTVGATAGAPLPAYYFPSAGTGATSSINSGANVGVGSASIAADGSVGTSRSPPGLNPRLVSPPPLLHQNQLYQHQSQGYEGIASVPTVVSTVVSAAGGTFGVSAPPPGLQFQNKKVSAPPPGLG